MGKSEQTAASADTNAGLRAFAGVFTPSVLTIRGVGTGDPPRPLGRHAVERRRLAGRHR